MDLPVETPAEPRLLSGTASLASESRTLFDIARPKPLPRRQDRFARLA